jgi:hypothetical protein
LLLYLLIGLVLGIGAFSVAARIAVYRSSMNPGEEVAVVISDAQGEAIFRLSDDGQTLHYRVIVSEIDNVTQSHIHLAPAGVNGGIVVWLYPAGPPATLIPGTTNGILMEGTITSANLVNALAGQDLSVLVAAIEAGNTYVNVHTSQYPPGEIRGQVR